MKTFVCLAVMLLLILSCGTDSTGPEEGQSGEKTYTTEGFSFTWQQDPDDSDYLLVTLAAPTTGWVAVGFQPTAFMKDANLIIGYVESDTPHLRDDFGTGQFTHASDESLGGTADAVILGGNESEGETVLEFRIPLDSGDAYDAVLSIGDSHTFIFAYGADGADDFTSAHIWAESASFEL